KSASFLLGLQHARGSRMGRVAEHHRAGAPVKDREQLTDPGPFGPHDQDEVEQPRLWWQCPGLVDAAHPRGQGVQQVGQAGPAALLVRAEYFQAVLERGKAASET